MKKNKAGKRNKARLFACGIYTGKVLMLSLAGGASVAMAAESGSAVNEVDFSTDFMRTGGTVIDVSRYSKGAVLVPGQYRADLYLNKVWIGLNDVNLRSFDGGVQPCFDRALLERIGVDLSKLNPDAASKVEQGESCTPLSQLVPDATAVFDMSEQRLDINLPQVALLNHARGYVDPAYWDNGVTAGRVAYNANVYHGNSGGHTDTQSYVGLNAGFNVGAWRFRHVGNYNSSDTGTHYQSVQTSLQRAIAPLKSQLTLGDAFTDGMMFDSVGFRGAQLATDDRMYPESQRGYAPVVHGIANTNARVQIRQNGNIIYETTVGAGAFEINDLYPTGYGGDLQVVVTEADGSVHTSQVPFAPPVNAVRQGVTRFSVTAGEYRNPSVRDTPWLTQATMQHGFSNLLTGYGGVTAADGYAAAVGGVALNTSYGALGLDVTQADTSLRNAPDMQGQSVRLSYSKLVAPTNTNITLGAYRYSSNGYLGLQDAMLMREVDRGRSLGGVGQIDRTRGRLQATVNQDLPAGYGSFYASASTQDYWNRSGRDTQFQFGYNNNFRRFSFGATAARQFDVIRKRWDDQVMFTVGIPLGSGAYRPYSTSTLQHDSMGATTMQESLSGTLGTDNAFGYGLNASHATGTDSGSTSNAGANLSYVSPVARFTGTASRGQDYTQTGAGISGGFVVYGGGVAFTPSMGETSVIVEAKDAAGARVANDIGLKVDRWGHALLANVVPFSRNSVEIDPKGLPLNVELKSTQLQTAPTAGAVVRLKFETENLGRSAVLRLSTPDGKLPPFGAEVFDAEGNSIGTVAQTGRVIVRGLKSNQGEVVVKWNGPLAQSCHARYTLPEGAKGDPNAITIVSTPCLLDVVQMGSAAASPNKNATP
ncbi:fimbria/pilus outer membrane usher protein [Rhodanobacter sp. MP7CTX1]|uniref:fimbria/pilus outer membrane usher protein n=1 Tax=Rhodanobacter sp. MP7CTX1 TaxID=2723084 RepID=UPI0017946A8D|nr:fimbria/pilus outer membrane usher protein [Rhodanobacter sp. MP7CTX1]MBB6187348.1 outer membrane usher protein [Rhodanobacter sp. MP7CTX1]